MITFLDCDPTFADAAAAVAAVVGTTEVVVRPDDDPLPAVGGDGRQRAVVGAPGGPALPGVVVVVRLPAGVCPWIFHDRFHARLAATLLRVLPVGTTWRLLFDGGEPGAVPFALARSGRARARESRARPSPLLKEPHMEARGHTRSLVDDVVALVMQELELAFGIRPDGPSRAKYRARLVAGFAGLPYRPGDVLEDDLRWLALKLDALAEKVNRMRPDDELSGGTNRT